MIKKNNQNGLVFRDKGRKYRPVNLYKKDKKIAGWNETSVKNGIGKNLFDIPYIDKTIPLTTIACNIKENIVINAINDNLTFSELVWRFRIKYQDGSYIYISDGTFPRSLTVAALNPITEITYRGNTITSGRYKDIQIEYGTTATEYEPYHSNGLIAQTDTYNDSAFIRINGKSEQNGTPSPDYPSEINSVSNFDLVSCGKNLFDVESALAYFPNVEHDSDIGVTLSRSDGTSWEKKPVFITLPAGTYYFSTTGNKAKLQIRDENSEIISYNVTTATSISLNRTTGLKIKILTETSIYPWVIGNFQISATATPYTPFQGMQTINFPYTLRSLPDGTKDYIEIDNINKTAKLYKNIETITFNGTENWVQTGSIPTGFRVVALLKNDAVSNSSSMCSHFNSIGTETDTVNELLNFHYSSQYNLRLKILSSRLTSDDVAGVKAWLVSQYNAGTPVKVIYKLATPVVTDLDYNEVKTYYPYTNIYTNAIIQPTLDGKIRIIDK